MIYLVHKIFFVSIKYLFIIKFLYILHSKI